MIKLTAAQLVATALLLGLGLAGGAYGVARWQAPPASSAPGHAGHGHAEVYTCPMHPKVVSDRPGSCPICGMDLVKKAQAAATTSDAEAVGISLSPRQRVLANVATASVGRRVLTRRIEAVGRVAFDESRLSQLSARVDGRIERLLVATTGAVVRPGQVIATIYSPDLVAAQREYLSAFAAWREMRTSPYAELRDGARTVFDATRERLLLLGVTRAQLGRLESTRRPETSFPIVAAKGGVVIAKKVQAGQYVKTGDPLYDLADLSRVWVEAQVYEAELGAVRPGMAATVRVDALPDHPFTGRVEAVLPALEAATRTATVRIGLDNPKGLLRADMYARAAIAVEAASGLAVPASAVIATGRRHLVYVEDTPNHFVPRTVTVGAKTGDYYPVRGGLRQGEHVAVSGGFLLDASAQLNGEAEVPDEGAPAGHGDHRP